MLSTTTNTLSSFHLFWNGLFHIQQWISGILRYVALSSIKKGNISLLLRWKISSHSSSVVQVYLEIFVSTVSLVVYSSYSLFFLVQSKFFYPLHWSIAIQSENVFRQSIHRSFCSFGLWHELNLLAYVNKIVRCSRVLK